MEKGFLSKQVYPELTTTQKLSITGKNFHFWKIKIPFLLADYGLHHLLEPPPSETETIPMSTVDNEFAVKLICQTLDDQLSLAFMPYNRHKAKSILNFLFTQFLNSIVKISKIREYMNYHLAEDGDINHYIFRTRALAKEVEIAGVEIPDVFQAMKLLDSLPEAWKWKVASVLIDIDARKEEVSFDSVSQRLARKTHMFAGDYEKQMTKYMSEPVHPGLSWHTYSSLKTDWTLTYACSDFSFWQTKVQSVLVLCGVAYTCSEDPKPSEEDAELYKKWQKDDFTCRHLILGAMDDDLFLSFHDYPTAKTLWKAVETFFRPTLSIQLKENWFC